MQGQHVFLRCWDERGNAGTWTAAITEGIVSKDIIRNIIEPRCNIDENLAHDALSRNPENNVLRIYHIDDDITVVSRTYWTADKITDSSSRGRMGAYTINHILTEDDSNEFNNNFGGAFNSKNFESYDALVERTGAASKNKITLDDSYNIFNNNIIQVDVSTFNDFGLNKTLFVEMMQGIYSAVENKKQIAVVLPSTFSKRWIENGDDAIEKFAYSVLSFIPYPTRRKLGVAVNWNGNIKDQMVGDMQLIFMHPDDSVSRLQAEGAAIIDLNKKKSSIQKDGNDEYFSFLWDNINNREAIEKFWNYLGEYSKLIRKMPSNSGAFNCVFLMYESIRNNYSDQKLLRKALLSAISIFAGAGSMIPEADEFITTAIKKLGVTAEHCDKELETALSDLVSKDRTTTTHQDLEYTILLSLCANGAADDTTVEILCDEVLKEGRDTSEKFYIFLMMHASDSIDAASLSMVKFVSWLFERFYVNKEVQYEDRRMTVLVSQILEKWAKEALDRSSFDKFIPVMKTYIAYLKENWIDVDASIVSVVYDLLFRASILSDESSAKEYLDFIFAEEKTLYHNKRILSGGTSAFALFFDAFIRSFESCDRKNKYVALNYYSRFYRLYTFANSVLREKALEIYKNKLSQIIENEKGALLIDAQTKEVIPELLKAPAIWSKEVIVSGVIDIEGCNISLEKYKPNIDRITTIIGLIAGTSHITVCKIIDRYVTTVNVNDRLHLYNTLSNSGYIEEYYSYAFYNEAMNQYLPEIRSYISRTDMNLISVLIRGYSRYWSQSYETGIIEKFADWLQTLVIDLPDTKNFVDTVSNIIDFYNKTFKILDDSSNTAPQLIDFAKDALRKSVIEKFNKYEYKYFCYVPGKLLSEISLIFFGIEAEDNIIKKLRSISFIDAYEDESCVRTIENIIVNRNYDQTCILRYRCDYHLRRKNISGSSRAFYAACLAIAEDMYENSSKQNPGLVEKYRKYSKYNECENKCKVIDILDITHEFRGSSYLKERFNIIASVLLEELHSSHREVFSNEEVIGVFKKKGPTSYKHWFGGGNKIPLDVATVIVCVVIGIVAAFAFIGACKLMPVLLAQGVLAMLVVYIGIIAALVLASLFLI